MAVQRFEITEGLQMGLRTDTRQPKNGTGMIDFTNLKPMGGLNARYWLDGDENTNGIITQPISNSELSTSGVAISWPTPQLFRLKNSTILIEDDGSTARFFTVTEGSTDTNWTIATNPDTVFDFAVPGNSVTVTTTGDLSQIWHVADLWDSVFFFNGHEMVFKIGIKDSANTYSGKWLHQNSVRVTTGCESGGRLLYGGFDTSNFWSSAWQTILNTRASELPSAIRSYDDVGENFVWWSSIGGGDALFLFNTTLAQTGHPDITGHDTDLDLYLEFFQRNEFGFMPMPWQGRVYRLMPLGSNVVVYCEQGIGVLTQSSAPIPTYGFKKILDVGVLNPTSMGGSNTEHVFITNGGHLWRLGVDLSLTKIGHRETFVGHTSTIINFDPREREYIISGPDEAHILTDAGLGGPIKQNIISSMRSPTTGSSGGQLIGIADSPTVARDTITLGTDWLDLEHPGMKKINQVHFIGDHFSESDTVTLTTRNAITDTSDVETEDIPLNPFGVADFSTTGRQVCTDFRVKLTVPSTSTPFVKQIDKIIVEWEPIDERFIG